MRTRRIGFDALAVPYADVDVSIDGEHERGLEIVTDFLAVHELVRCACCGRVKYSVYVQVIHDRRIHVEDQTLLVFSTLWPLGISVLAAFVRDIGTKESDELDDFNVNLQAAQLVQSLRQKDSVVLKYSSSVIVPFDPPIISTEWRLPRDLLRRESKVFQIQLQNEATAVVDITAFALWLLTGSYHEHTGFVQIPIYSRFCKIFELSPLTDESADTMVWCVKAAVVAWKLGQYVEAPRFQNHAMRRLFAAYTRDVPRFRITGDFLQWTRDGCDNVNLFFEDLIVRNWGDDSLIDTKHESWSRQIKENDRFRDEFIKAVAVPLEDRCGEPMDLEKYLVKED